MSQQYSLESSTSSSIKRKRGRPRKDNNPLSYTHTRVERSPMQAQIDLAKGKNGISIDEDEMIGRMISGVLEGAFDAGYLLSMRVSETETYLKGLVFEPGKFVPITMENDIAPLAKMYTRMDLCVENVDVSNNIYECVQLRNNDVMKGGQYEGVDIRVVEEEHEQIMIEIPNEASKEKNNGLDCQVLEDVSYSMVVGEEKMVDEIEESIAKEKLELLATLSIAMDEQDLRLLEPLAKKPRTEEGSISCEELKAATTLKQLEILGS